MDPHYSPTASSLSRDFDADPVELINKETNEKGVICIDAIGYEAVEHTGNTSSSPSSPPKNNEDNKKMQNIHDHADVKSYK